MDVATQLRFTSKFDAVEPLLGLAHHGRTRMRASIHPARFARFEGGTSPVASRLAAYAELIDQASVALSGVGDPDLTIELITHRFSPTSRVVLQRWYPGSGLEMGTEGRTEKRTKFGSIKQVYDAATMRALRTFFEAEIARKLPYARILYWT